MPRTSRRASGCGVLGAGYEEFRSPRTRLMAIVTATFLGPTPSLSAWQETSPAGARSPRAGDPKSQPDGKPEVAKTKPKPKAKMGRPSKGRLRRDPPGSYLGRPIADVMSWEG